jgi:hypothetical protein
MKNSVVWGVLFSSLVPQLAWAWGDLGHQAVGFVAEKAIQPSTKVAIERILGPEALAIAANWPDVMRHDERFKAGFHDYHFFEIPPGETFESVKTRAPFDALTVLQEYPKILKDPNRLREEKMIALRYILHVVGDIHQPLHTGNGIDNGGNLCEVEVIDPFESAQDPATGMIVPKPVITNLHTLWDEGILDFMKNQRRAQLEQAAKQPGGRAPPKRFFEYTHVVEQIEARQRQLQPRFRVPLSPPFQEAHIAQWINESIQLRDATSYPDAEAARQLGQRSIAFDAMTRPYCNVDKATHKTSTHQRSMRVRLDGTYLQSKVLTTEQQILKAGRRLAVFLDSIFAQAVSPDSRPLPQTLIPGLMIRNK